MTQVNASCDLAYRVAVELGEDALNALGESFVPAETFWLALLDSNYGKEFAESFKEARAELSNQINQEDTN